LNKKTVFKLIAIVFPLVVILVVEVMLRVFGYGENHQLFHKIISQNNTEYYVMNSDISKKYFKNTAFRSDNQSDLFLKNKTDNTFRVFVQGASTVVGFPFYKNGSFPRILKHRLSRTFPEKNIEIINTGITAVNSYTLLDLTDKIIEQKPDLVLIYAGHNEYYGALGAGSAVFTGNHPILVRSYLRLKNFRFFQLLENAYSRLFDSNGGTGYNVGETTLMEVMAREQQIPYNSEVYNAGINQFKSNFEKIISKYQDNDIPVILSTLVSNEKDIPPFISDPLAEDDFDEALEKDLRIASKIAEHNAKAAFKLGQFYLNKQKDSAKKYFHIAKELDLLRFRAPEEINEAIIDLSKKKNVHLVDTKKNFIAESQSGFIDNELMTEHVHPNVKGNFIIADAFYNKLRELQLIGSWENSIPYEEALRDIPVTRIDSIRGKFIVEDLKQAWPYVLEMSGRNPVRGYHSLQNPTFEEGKAINLYSGREKWEDVMRQAYHIYKNDGDFKNALRVAQSLISEFPEQPRVYEMAGNMCMEMGEIEYANFYFQKAKKLK
jgi:lysophospholipase L1-like esterase